MAISLSEEAQEALIAAIKAYFLEDHGEEIGDLKASLFLDFIVQEVGPSIYNQAIKDAQAQMQRAVADLDLTLHEPEFGWSENRR